MLIITGRVTVDPAERDAYVAAHTELVQRARAAPGCLDLAISADPVDPARVNNVERWESQADLDAWRKVAHAPRLVPRIKDGDVRLYVIAEERPVFAR
ncbi:putative quinol monooxygenase [Labedaea rhizosphaerae]|uniref:Quinol monooxygenase YgiN n=1 Tax=Labedaea rhizosphaerae TaxID=598644 RepID=A0A4R6RY12_LABRH|nr:antibiotic biosynthesis monooxygenase family protein [Labedaea rhizosphaerae]TDP91106.1 quinol monooxygenase YgiN [Labedaea rhizosphaerae]